ncbi:hypothetical protein DKX38_020102 [Salix brachista]|uniref:60S ribosomal protein L35 n=1 Tax=Salix brachista TaxID=2182728 RepID=A0A5N5KI79_9ROSI|nr:hypothetical protein DKX38_020102 [Salix brachista]
MLKDLKAELALLCVANVTSGAPNKLSKIKVVRLLIAQVLTMILQKQKAVLREAYKNKKFLPQVNVINNPTRTCLQDCLVIRLNEELSNQLVFIFFTSRDSDFFELVDRSNLSTDLE